MNIFVGAVNFLSFVFFFFFWRPFKIFDKKENIPSTTKTSLSMGNDRSPESQHA